MQDVEFKIGDVVTFRECEEHDPVQAIVRGINDYGSDDYGIIIYKLEYLTLFNLQNRRSTEFSSYISVSPKYIINSKYYLTKQ